MQKEELKALTEQLRAMKEAGVTVEGNVYVYVRDDSYMVHYNNEWYLNETDTLDIPLEVLETRADGPVDAAGKVMEVSVNIWYVQDSKETSAGPEQAFASVDHYFEYPADDTTIEMLMELQEDYAGTSADTTATTG